MRMFGAVHSGARYPSAQMLQASPPQCPKVSSVKQSHTPSSHPARAVPRALAAQIAFLAPETWHAPAGGWASADESRLGGPTLPIDHQIRLVNHFTDAGLRRCSSPSLSPHDCFRGRNFQKWEK